MLARLALTCCLFSALPAVGVAGTITTTFAGGNGQAGNMFDLTVGNNPLTVTRLDINVAQFAGGPGDPVPLAVYLKVGSYVGSESTPVAWTLVSSTPMTAVNPSGVPTPVDVTDFTLAANTTYGVYVLFRGQPNGPDPTTFLSYTNGANVYSNADLSLTLGVGLRGEFGTVFSPRTWNGTVYYDVTAVPAPAGLVLAGLGVPALALLRRRKPA